MIGSENSGSPQKARRHRVVPIQVHPYKIARSQKLFLSSNCIIRIVNRISLIPILNFAFILLAIASNTPALGSVTEYGRSVEDLIGAFSIEKTIQIGGSSQNFLSGSEADPLSPPRSLSSGLMADDQAPSLAGLVIEPPSIPANYSQPVNITLHAIDDQAFFGAEARFTGPGGMEAVALFPSASITAGSAKDGWYNASIILPANQTGEWRLESLTMVDREGNRRILLEKELEERGFDANIFVVQPDSTLSQFT